MLLDIQELQSKSGATILALAGRLGLGRESQRLEAMIDELVAKSARKVIFDMMKVNYIDSAGVGLLALASGKLKQSGGKLVVVTGPGRVLDLLKLTQIITVVTVCSSLAEAKAVPDGTAAGA